jgi:glycosyltransferase involved in cell wall biosynthesis
VNRLLVVASPVYSSGGGLRHALATARAATEDGWETTVVVGCRRSVDDVAELAETIAPGAICHIHAGSALRSLPWTLWRIISWQRHGRGVIYAPFAQSMLLAFAAAGLSGRRRRSLIAAFQGAPIPENVAPWKRRIYRRVFPLILRAESVQVASVSRAQLDEAFAELAPGVPVRGTVVGNVANGNGDAPWVPGNGVRVRERWVDPVVVVLARLSWEKGVDLAIKATSLAASPFKLVIGGDGPERAHLEALAADLSITDRVTFAGWCDAVDLLSRASLVLIPSRREGLPLVLLEAAWTRVPVVAAAVGGIPEASTGLPQVTLVPPGDAAEFARAIDRSLAAEHEFAAPALNWSNFSLSVSRLLNRCA